MLINEIYLPKDYKEKREQGWPQTLSIKETKIFSYLEKYCSKSFELFIKYNQCLYRGMKNGNHPFYYINSLDSVRPSSAVTEFTSYLPSWKSFPPRNKSIFCSASIDEASSYGSVSYIFPFDSVKKFAVCGHVDTLNAFNLLSDDVINADFYSINSFLSCLRIVSGECTDRANLKDFILNFETKYKKQLKDYYKEVPDRFQNGSDYKYLQLGLMNLREPLLAYLSKKFEPTKNDFTLTDFDHLPIWEGDSEVWFAGKAIGVSLAGSDELFNRYRKSKGLLTY